MSESEKTLNLVEEKLRLILNQGCEERNCLRAAKLLMDLTNLRVSLKERSVNWGEYARAQVQWEKEMERMNDE